MRLVHVVRTCVVRDSGTIGLIPFTVNSCANYSQPPMIEKDNQTESEIILLSGRFSTT